MDDAVVKSFRRHLEKNRPRRTRLEDELYRIRRRELKLVHAIDRVFYSHYLAMPHSNGTRMSHGPGLTPSSPGSLGAPGFEIVRAYFHPPSSIEVRAKENLLEPYRSIVRGLIHDLREQIKLPVEVIELDALRTD